MKRKKQLLIAMLCTFSMLSHSAVVVAQSKDKKQEPKSGARQAAELPSNVILIGEPGEEFEIEVPPPPPNLGFAPYAAAPQVEFVHNEFSFDGKVVKGAPYSADTVTETIQTMGDGNRIIRNSSAKIYRDSAGRTRREQALKAVGPWSVSGDAPTMINISDPVSGVNYSLNPKTRTANKMVAARLSNLNGDLKMTAELRAAELKASTRLMATKGADASADVVTGVVTEAVTGAVSGVVFGAGAGAVAPGISMSAGDRVFAFSSDGEVNRESLGTETIEGVQAEGTRVTFTIPAGKIGNERPIVSVNERWYSPELQAVVLSKNSDPRMGETTYRLTNIVRTEPDPLLFQVPADYTVNEHSFDFGSRSADVLKKLEVERKARKPNDN